jgi:CBS-domain-containing membrane protein
MLTVSDVMSRGVLTIDPDAKLEDVAWGLTLKGVTGAPVRDEHGHLIGVLSKSDLVDPEKMESEHPPRTAKDAMTPVLFAAKADDPLTFAVERMVRTGVHRLVVIDELGALVGIITPMDVLKALLDGRIGAEDFRSKS